MKTSEVLYTAADDVAQEWAAGPFGMRVDGPHCLMGAIGAAIGARTVNVGIEEHVERVYSYDDVDESPAGQAMRRYLAVPDFHGLYEWNDRRTGPEVEAALRACAIIEAARENDELPVDVRQTVLDGARA